MWPSTPKRRRLAIARLAEDPALRQRMGEAGRQTVHQRFDWPVVARLHHQLYAELAERRCAGQERTGLEAQHPLRGDPFRDFAPFATDCLGPETELRLAMPLPELNHRLSNLTSLDRCYEQLHASPEDVQRLLVQLQGEGAQLCSLTRLLTVWPVEQHDELRLSLTWLAKLGCIHWSHPRQRDDSGGKSLPAGCVLGGSAAAKGPSAAAHLG